MTRSSALGSTEWYKSTNTPPRTSKWLGSREGTTKHAACVLEVDGRGKRELGDDVSKHVIGRAPDIANRGLLDQVADVMVLDVNVLGLGGCHGVGGKGDAALVVLKGGDRADDGETNNGKKLTKKHSFLRGCSEGHVLGLGSREGNTFLEFTAPRNGATKHHIDEAGAGVVVNAVSEGGVLPDEGIKRDGAVEGEAVVSGSRDVAEDALGLFPMAACERARVAIEEADRG